MKVKEKQAISLIVLVITILVLSILAATVIISLSNTNIISEASDAVEKANEKQVEEAKSLMYAEGMLGNSPEDIVIGDLTLMWDAENNEVIEKKDGKILREGVVIPDGFCYVGGTKNTGLVISDNVADKNKGVDYECVGNQFVWVPVDDYSSFMINFNEPYTYNDWEVKEYNAMCESVKKYGGFYIARFEAGDGDATYGTNGVTQGERTDVTEAHTVVSKKGAYVYNYVPWGESMTEIGTTGAVYLSQNMYKDSSSVVSTLCYGAQWYAIMDFVSDDEHDV